MTETAIHDFNFEVNCIYDEDRYSVRDNGAVLRHQRTGKRLRPTDNLWTFGKPNNQNGYMYIGQVRIHRIVATAFHGEPPTSEHVVDHIDTNRRNNRPENLRWLTRLENALLNPITVKRIVCNCGSIEAFLEDPSKLSSGVFDRNYEWMRRVTPEEAQACLKRMQLWAKSDKQPTSSGSMGEWIFKPFFLPKSSPETPREVAIHTGSLHDRILKQSSLIKKKLPSHESGILDGHNEEVLSKSTSDLKLIDYGSTNCDQKGISAWIVSDLVMAKTPGAAQRKWRTPTEFPSCPQNEEEKPIAAYAAKLTAGAIFALNNFSKSIVLKATVADDNHSICVMCEQTETDAMKPWKVAKVTFEDGLYVHTSIGTFFTKEGAEKHFFLACGLEWTGGDTFDDYC